MRACSRVPLGPAAGHAVLGRGTRGLTAVLLRVTLCRPWALTTASESLFMFVLRADSPAPGLRGDADHRHAQFTPGAEPSRRVKIF